MEEQSRDLQAQAEQFARAHPEVEQVPDPVARAWAGGQSLEAAFAAWEQARKDRELEAVRQENQVLRQNAKAAAQAPVRGVSGGVEPERGKDDFLRGLESEGW